MKLKSVLLGLALLLTGAWVSAEMPASTTQASALRTLFIHPTSTSVLGGKANLKVGALRRQAATFVGEYDIKVSPWSFKNETGKLVMLVSDESLKRLSEGLPVEFSGSVTTHGETKARPVIAKATPAGKEQGSVTFSFTGEEKKIIFNSKYNFQNE